MKSHANSLLNVAFGLLDDVRMAYPEYTGVVRDKTRLTRLVETRGLGVFTLDLPSRLDTLIQGLETGRLDSKGVVRHSKRYPVPRLFGGLYMRIFNKDLCLMPNPDVNAISFLVQMFGLGKKTEVPCSKKRLHAAVEGYHDVERELHLPTLKWDCDVLDPDGRLYGLHLHNLMVDDLPLFGTDKSEADGRIKDLLERCQQVADLVIERIGQFEPFLYSEKRIENGQSIGVKHGPGAVAERSGRLFDKNMFQNWPAKLATWFPFEEFGKMPNDQKEHPRNHEVAARLIAVPKTAKGPRLIASEPSEHQWCQQLMLSWFEERLAEVFDHSFVTLRNQQPSRHMAKLGSLDKSLATVDLSSASDRLTCYVVERMFRRSITLVHALHSCRTRYVKDAISQPTRFVKLRKFASQGTAVTFPVQSLIFLICALSVSIKGKPTWSKIARLRDKVRVFGDDIIIPSHGYADIVDLLTTLQLKVNDNKSFVAGSFRESCGMDAYAGFEITPVKPKTTIPDGPASCKAVLDTYNNLFKKGFWNAADSLSRTKAGSFLTKLPVMSHDAGATGRSSFSSLAVVRDLVLNGFRDIPRTIEELQRVLSSKVRFNTRTQQFELWTQKFSGTTTYVDRDDGYSSLLAFCSAAPLSDSIFRDTVRDGRRYDGSHTRKRMGWETISNLF